MAVALLKQTPGPICPRGFSSVRTDLQHSGVLSRLVPLFGRCVVQKVQPAKMTKGGIYLPSSASPQSGCHMAKVLAVSPPKQAANSAVSDDFAKLQVGQTVMVPEFGGMKVQLEEEEVFVFRGEDILAIVKDQ